MMLENIGEADEALAIEEADAWFEYLESVRSHAASDRYDEVEPWAWSRLNAATEARGGRARQAAPGGRLAPGAPLLPCERTSRGSTEPGSGERESRRSNPIHEL